MHGKRFSRPVTSVGSRGLYHSESTTREFGDWSVHERISGIVCEKS
jgi:hypothetical protein